MSHWEREGQSNEWYTPSYIFNALGCHFDMDVAAPHKGPWHVNKAGLEMLRNPDEGDWNDYRRDDQNNCAC